MATPDFNHNSYYLMFCLREGGVGFEVPTRAVEALHGLGDAFLIS
jgi:hypothetical protein